MLHRRPSPRWALALGLALIVAAITAVSISVASSHDDGQQVANMVAATPSQLEDPATPGRVLFTSDLERGDFPEWYVQALPGRVRLVHSSPYEGRANARFEVRPGDVEPDTGSQRAELSGPTYHEGQDLYVRTAFRVPKANSFRGPWELIQQFHDESDTGSPGTAVFFTSDGRMRVGAGDSSQIDWNSPRLQTDRWYELVYRVKLSRDPRVGFVEVWFDGRRQRLGNGRFRDYGETMHLSEAYLKTGIYRSQYSEGVSVIEDDSVIVVERQPH
jgi:Polysaccharide lyase